MIKTAANHVVRALTIAGSDSGGGAGIQADLKTMHQFGVYGSSAITALTAQNTLGVQSVLPIPHTFVTQQLLSVMSDVGADAIKTGMLASSDTIAAIGDFLSDGATLPLVVDPVMIAKGGAQLLPEDAVAAMRQQLLPLATVVTPNIPEAATLAGCPLSTWAQCRQAAIEIAQWGGQYIVIKGGHGENLEGATGPFETAGYAVDLIYASATQTFTYLATPRVPSVNTHGTGCTFSAAVCALLAQGAHPLAAIAGAKTYIYKAIVRSQNWDVGSGHGPLDHSAPARKERLLKEGGAYLLDRSSWTLLF